MVCFQTQREREREREREKGRKRQRKQTGELREEYKKGNTSVTRLVDFCMFLVTR